MPSVWSAPWYTQGLHWRLLLAYNEIASRGLREVDPGAQMEAERKAERLRQLGETRKALIFEFAGDLMRRPVGGGDFLIPVLPEAALTLPRMRKIEGFKKMSGGQPSIIITRTPYANLSIDECLQIDACADLILGTMFADLWPTTIAVGGPRNFLDGGDIVGVRSLATSWAMKKGMTFERAKHVIGVAGKALGISEALYGQGRRREIAKLVYAVTNEVVSDKALRTLWFNRTPLASPNL
jgi:hypothetical protein